MHRTHRRNMFFTIGWALMVLVVAGCNVLFVPRRPEPSPTATPIQAVHRFPELEARLPDQVDGKTLQKFSLTSDADLQRPKTLEVLQRLGKTPADVQLAKGSASGLDLQLSALRIVGANGAQAAATFQAVDESDATSTSIYEPAVVAGKRVLIRTTGRVIDYLYPLEDIVFILTGQRPLVEEALVAIH